MKGQRKNYPRKKDISTNGLRIGGGIYYDGKCIKKCKDEAIEEFLQSLQTLKLKYSGGHRG